jgi:hypothetical protein
MGQGLSLFGDCCGYTVMGMTQVANSDSGYKIRIAAALRIKKGASVAPRENNGEPFIGFGNNPIRLFHDL